ncbi:pilus assembly PilX family protein [Salinisphaera aquimarina]|uniref:PilX N-terminal domain-containing pilus assembly protein n=1 Tax=Salinisphaera aquimarina TaxID=2094031 RepID=A0ABV7EP07_9GAMM
MTHRYQRLTAQTSRGFILVTSLVFLVVITLLAVSAINSTTIQERMASNQREKSRARQAADAALRQGESLLGDTAFDKVQTPNTTVSVKVRNNDDQGSHDLDVKLWRKNDMFATSAEKTDPVAFLSPRLWALNEALAYTLDADMSAVQYYLEDYQCLARDLNPDSRAVCDGSLVYRITARAQGQNPAAIAVTQSLYEKHY